LKSEEELPRVQEERNILHTAKQRKAKWPGHMLHVLKCVTEGKIQGWEMRNKTYTATEKTLEVERRSTRLHSLEKLL
jgi:hypothetical protein